MDEIMISSLQKIVNVLMSETLGSNSSQLKIIKEMDITLERKETLEEMTRGKTVVLTIQPENRLNGTVKIDPNIKNALRWGLMEKLQVLEISGSKPLVWCQFINGILYCNVESTTETRWNSGESDIDLDKLKETGRAIQYMSFPSNANLQRIEITRETLMRFCLFINIERSEKHWINLICSPLQQHYDKKEGD